MLQGAGEIFRGRFNGAINKLARDQEGQAKDEEVVQRGQRMYRSGTYERR